MGRLNRIVLHDVSKPGSYLSILDSEGEFGRCFWKRSMIYVSSYMLNACFSLSVCRDGGKKNGDKTLTVLMVQEAAELPIFLKHVVGATNMGIKYGETASVCVEIALHHSHPKIKRTFPNLIRMSSKYHLIT